MPYGNVVFSISKMPTSKRRHISLARAVLPILLIILGLSTYLVISLPTRTNTQANSGTNSYGFTSVKFICSDKYQGTIGNLKTCQSRQSLLDQTNDFCKQRSVCGKNDCPTITLKSISYGNICSLK